jgi:hypothetical protein
MEPELITHKKRKLFDTLDLASYEDTRELGVAREDYDLLVTVARWAETFLCQTNVDLGRTGAVCPFAKPAIEHRLFLIGIIDVDLGRILDFAKEVDFYRQWFVELQGSLHPERNACMVLITSKCDLNSSDKLDHIQEQLKDDFVQEGLMIGQFHPKCEVEGLWNPDFRPLASPLPLLAIRRLVPSDLPFLTSKSEYMVKYFSMYAPAIPRHTLNYLASKVSGNGELKGENAS